MSRGTWPQCRLPRRTAHVVNVSAARSWHTVVVSSVHEEEKGLLWVHDPVVVGRVGPRSPWVGDGRKGFPTLKKGRVQGLLWRTTVRAVRCLRPPWSPVSDPVGFGSGRLCLLGGTRSLYVGSSCRVEPTSVEASPDSPSGRSLVGCLCVGWMWGASEVRERRLGGPLQRRAPWDRQIFVGNLNSTK